MCVIFFYINSNPSPGGYKVILASNRDEFYARSTRAATQWKNVENVYGGIDLEPGREGGTWLAIGADTNVIKIAALLNLTGEPKPRDAAVKSNNLNEHTSKHSITSNSIAHSNKKTANANPNPTSPKNIHNNNFLLGRGMIVADFVSSPATLTIDDYNNDLLLDCTKYSAFNFVSIQISGKSAARIKLCSNVPPILEDFKEGKCYGFGNSLPIKPFEKVRHGKERFQCIVDEVLLQETTAAENSTTTKTTTTPAVQSAALIEKLLNLLKCKQKYWPDEELARRAPNWGEHLSAINVYVPFADYGSRTHTVILVDANDKMTFVEETMAGLDPDAEWMRTSIEKQFFTRN